MAEPKPLTKWDVTNYLDSEDAIAAYEESVREDVAAQLADAKANVARARERYGLSAPPAPSRP